MECGVYSPVCQLRLSESRRYPPWSVPTTTHGKSVFSEGDIEHSFLKPRPQLNMPLGILYLGGSLLNTKGHPVMGHQKSFRITIQTQQRQQPCQVYLNQPVSLNSGSEFGKDIYVTKSLVDSYFTSNGTTTICFLDKEIDGLVSGNWKEQVNLSRVKSADLLQPD